MTCRRDGSGWRQLEDFIAAASDGHAEIAAHVERAWSSATFTGARHELTLSFRGEAAAAIGEALMAELPDSACRLPSHLVADARIIFAHRQLGPARLDCRIEFLLLDERAAA